MSTNFKNSRGSLNKSTKKTNPKAPDYFGSLTIDEELARYIVGKIKAGEDLVKLDMSAWLRESANGKFISISLGTPYVKAGAAPTKKVVKFEPDEDAPW
jgi:hypothetical protein